MHQADGAPNIRIVGMPFCPVQERPKTVYFDQTKAAQNRFEANGKVEKIERKQTETVNVKYCAIHVVLAQLDAVRLEDAFFEVSRPKVDQNVQNVKKIGKVVK